MGRVNHWCTNKGQKWIICSVRAKTEFYIWHMLLISISPSPCEAKKPLFKVIVPTLRKHLEIYYDSHQNKIYPSPHASLLAKHKTIINIMIFLLVKQMYTSDHKQNALASWKCLACNW